MKARDRATVEAERDKAMKEVAALTTREADLRTELGKVQQRLLVLHGHGGSVLRNIADELADLEYPVVNAGDRDDYVVISLTRAQATVRRYGHGPGGRDTVVRAGLRYAPVSLEQCRAAWAAAGRVLP